MATIYWKRKIGVQIQTQWGKPFWQAKGIWADIIFMKGSVGFMWCIFVTQRNKPSIRIPLSTYPLYKIFKMLEVIGLPRAKSEIRKAFEKSKTKDWHLFEELYKRKLEEKEKN